MAFGLSFVLLCQCSGAPTAQPSDRELSFILDIGALRGHLSRLSVDERPEQIADWVTYGALLDAGYLDEVVQQATWDRGPYRLPGMEGAVNLDYGTGRHVSIPGRVLWLILARDDPQREATVIGLARRHQGELGEVPKRFVVLSYSYDPAADQILVRTEDSLTAKELVSKRRSYLSDRELAAIEAVYRQPKPMAAVLTRIKDEQQEEKQKQEDSRPTPLWRRDSSDYPPNPRSMTVLAEAIFDGIAFGRTTRSTRATRVVNVQPARGISGTAHRRSSLSGLPRPRVEMQVRGDRAQGQSRPRVELQIRGDPAQGQIVVRRDSAVAMTLSFRREPRRLQLSLEFGKPIYSQGAVASQGPNMAQPVRDTLLSWSAADFTPPIRLGSKGIRTEAELETRSTRQDNASAQRNRQADHIARANSFLDFERIRTLKLMDYACVDLNRNGMIDRDECRTCSLRRTRRKGLNMDGLINFDEAKKCVGP